MTDEEIIGELQDHKNYCEQRIKELEAKLEGARRDLARCLRVLDAMRELQVKQRIYEANKNKEK